MDQDRSEQEKNALRYTLLKERINNSAKEFEGPKELLFDMGKEPFSKEESLDTTIRKAVEGATCAWFKEHPQRVQEMVASKMEKMANEIIMKEVRVWINNYLPQYVKGAVQQLIDLMRKSS